MLANYTTIGIVGGMGPLAGSALFDRIVYNTPASLDQQHLPVLLASFPAEIGDRSQYLAGAISDNPAHAIDAIIERLERAGAQLIGMACNTSHAPAIFNELQACLERRRSVARLFHMPHETCLYIARELPSVKRVGIMATTGTYKTNLYSHLLREHGYEVVLPDPDFQDAIIHNMIYNPNWGIKANASLTTPQVQELFAKALNFFAAQKAQGVILGCTEFSLVCQEKEVMGMHLVDATDCLAKALVVAARSPLLTAA